MSKVKPLIDGDMLRYEVGYGVEFKEGDGVFIHDFDSASELLQHKISVILAETNATEEPTIYLTQDKHLAKRKGVEYSPNFRDILAVTAPYKGNRNNSKPFHYDNLTEFMLSKYDCKIAEGIEADDLLSIDQNLGGGETIICSRDKDLRITPGWHYSWECGKAAGVGPILVEPLGELQPPVKNKMFGTGLKFFYSQLITGDPVDNIKGIPGRGIVYAYNLLKDCTSEKEMFDLVLTVYSDYILDNLVDIGEEFLDEYVERKTKEYLKEQAALLWIIQELDTEGKPIHYKMIDER